MKFFKDLKISYDSLSTSEYTPENIKTKRLFDF